MKIIETFAEWNSAVQAEVNKLRAVRPYLNKNGEERLDVMIELLSLASFCTTATELTARIKELQAEQDKAASAANFGARSVQAFDTIAQSAIASEIIDFLREVKDAFMDCVEGAGSFEEAMSTVEALSQANAREMAALSAEAKDLGATTKFTAKESADAMGSWLWPGGTRPKCYKAWTACCDWSQRPVRTWPWCRTL